MQTLPQPCRFSLFSHPLLLQYLDSRTQAEQIFSETPVALEIVSQCEGSCRFFCHCGMLTLPIQLSPFLNVNSSHDVAQLQCYPTSVTNGKKPGFAKSCVSIYNKEGVLPMTTPVGTRVLTMLLHRLLCSFIGSWGICACSYGPKRYSSKQRDTALITEATNLCLILSKLLFSCFKGPVGSSFSSEDRGSERPC